LLSRLSGSSSDSDADEDVPDDRQPHPPTSSHTHPLNTQLQPPPPQQQHTQSHLIYSDEDIDDTLNVIDEQTAAEPVWNSNSLYDRLEPIPKETVSRPPETVSVTTSSTSGGILSRIKSRSRSPEALKPPELSKPPSLHQVLSPPPPPPPKIPTGQFVAPPGSPHATSTSLTTDSAKRHHTDGDHQAWITSATGGPPESQSQERNVNVGKSQVVRRQHLPSADTSATRNVVMAWVKEQQSK